MTCEIARDLIPLCADGAASEQTVEAVNAHMAVCTECRKYYEICKGTQKKLSPNQKLRATLREVCPDIPDLDCRFANLSAKLKKRRVRNIGIAVGVLLGMAAYVTVDIVKAVKKGAE